MSTATKIKSDCFDRVKHLHGLKDGWLDGKGKAPSNDCLDMAESLLHLLDWWNPYIYPTAEGNVEFEWDVGLDGCVIRHTLLLRWNKDVRYWYFYDGEETKPEDPIDFDVTLSNPLPSDVVKLLTENR